MASSTNVRLYQQGTGIDRNMQQVKEICVAAASRLFATGAREPAMALLSIVGVSDPKTIEDRSQPITDPAAVGAQLRSAHRELYAVVKGIEHELTDHLQETGASTDQLAKLRNVMEIVRNLGLAHYSKNKQLLRRVYVLIGCDSGETASSETFVGERPFDSLKDVDEDIGFFLNLKLHEAPRVLRRKLGVEALTDGVDTSRDYVVKIDTPNMSLMSTAYAFLVEVVPELRRHMRDGTTPT